jgi:hypothetical protein
MKLSDFILLAADDKKMMVLHVGVLIGKRMQGDSMVFLFRLPAYYVEMYCRPATKAVEAFHAFDSVVPLSPYLESIEIGDLLS